MEKTQSGTTVMGRGPVEIGVSPSGARNEPERALQVGGVNDRLS
jgi:hypothetical protein